MIKENDIRCLALAIIKKGDAVLVLPGHDDVKNENFFRLLGGGIEFGETSQAALEREFREELGAEIGDVRLIKVLENVFTFNGKQGHEVCFVYEANFVDKRMYEKDEFAILDGNDNAKAVWLEPKGNENIYPEGSNTLMNLPAG